MISTGFVVLLAISALVGVMAVRGIKIVSQSEAMVVERLGKFDRVLQAGINIIWPILERPRLTEWKFMTEGPNGTKIINRRYTDRIDLRETVFDIPQQSVITSDNVVININTLLYFQIVDPKSTVYEIANLPDAVEKLTQTSLRNVIGELELDKVLSSREDINSKLQTVLDEASEKWGVKVNRVELQEISLPGDIQVAMEKQMRAERDKRATILESEGIKQSQILKSEGEMKAAVNRAEGERDAQIALAEGQAKARIKTAEGEAEAINQITAAIKESGASPSQYLIAIRYVETLKDIASGSNKVVFLPYEASGILGALGGIKELASLGISKS